MSLASSLVRLCSGSARTLSRERLTSARSRPRLEVLEERCVPSIYTVTNTADSGAGSLRQAILNANGNPGTDTIQFDIPGSGNQVIRPASALPAITDPVIIDATTQPGYADVPIIELTGGSAGAGVTGLTITAGGSTVKGLHIDHFSGDGIDLTTSGGDTIESTYIGTSNGGVGLKITSANNTIGGSAAGAGNVISGNTGNGVYIDGSAASGNVLWGNYIGTTPTGMAALANGSRGIFVDGAPNNTIGGTMAGTRNVISGNDYTAIVITNNGASGNLVEGNYVGIGADGSTAVPPLDGGAGIRLGNAGNDNTIGGTVSGAGNVISGNTSNGVILDDFNGDTGTFTGVAASDNAVLDNIIGLNAAGTAAAPNTLPGVQLDDGASNNLLSGNVISGNSGDGIVLTGTGTNNNVIQGNLIGTNPAGSTAFGNARHGIEIIEGAASNMVGPGNAIAGNDLSGIYVNGLTTSNNTIQGNFIGTNLAGTAAIGNGSLGQETVDDQGIEVQNAANDTIGGTAAGAGNVIAGNIGNGIMLAAGATGMVIEGNYIGTNASSAANLGNGADGIRIDSSSGNTIGGTATGAGNVISGNGGNGITLLAHVGSTPPFTPGSNDPGGLTLTSAGIADGFILSTFIDQLPHTFFGPKGMAFNNAGQFLFDNLATDVYRFTSDKDNQPLSAYAQETTYNGDNISGITRAGNALYMTEAQTQSVIELNQDGTKGPTIISSFPPSPRGTQMPEDLVTNPVNGHLFLTTESGGQIFEINPLTTPATLRLVTTGTSTKRFFGFLCLIMTRYGPARGCPPGVSDITRRRLSNQGKR